MNLEKFYLGHCVPAQQNKGLWSSDKCLVARNRGQYKIPQYIHWHIIENWSTTAVAQQDINYSIVCAWETTSLISSIKSDLVWTVALANVISVIMSHTMK